MASGFARSCTVWFGRPSVDARAVLREADRNGALLLGELTPRIDHARAEVTAERPVLERGIDHDRRGGPPVYGVGQRLGVALVRLQDGIEIGFLDVGRLVDELAD
jgi:hypothetical protein